jgi:hypothetical protein
MWAFMVYGKLFVKGDEYQLGHPMAAFAPRQPYVPAARALHRRAQDGDRLPILEIPFSTVTPLRIPFYSTLMRILGRHFTDAMLRTYDRRQNVLHALFHMIEFADFRGTALDAAMDKTPALGIPFGRRCDFLEHTITRLATAGQCIPLRDYAEAEFHRLGLGRAA